VIKHIPLGDESLTWIDIGDPSDDDIEYLRQHFHFHQVALEDVARRHQRPKLDEYPEYSFCVVYAIRRADAPAARPRADELQFFWGKSFLVTIHVEPFPEIDGLADRAGQGTLPPIVDSEGSHVTIPDLVYRILDAVVDGYFPVIDALAEWVEDMEEQMFANQRQPTTLQAIFAVRKDLVFMRKLVAPCREVVNSFLRRDHALFDDRFYPYFQDLYDHTVRVIDSVDTYRDLLSSALDTYLSIVSNEVNQTVKRMTAVTAILMVDALIAGIYGMNFDYMPELHWLLGYPWSLALMAVASLGLWGVFRRIEWL
jgi:magnesium transporter